MPYLSELKHRRVIEPNGEKVGTLKDLAVRPAAESPQVQWAILATGDGEKVVRWSETAQEIGHLRLRTRLAALADPALPSETIRLSRDVIDRHIVDEQSGRTTQVNDVELTLIEGQLRVVGVDVGVRGLLRRIGVEGIADRLFGERLSRQIIPWRLVRLVEPAASIAD